MGRRAKTFSDDSTLKMQKHLFALAVLLVPMTYGYVTNSEYPTFSQCNPTTLSAIKAYWKLTERPKDVLRKFEQSGENILMHTSYDYKNTNNKCVYVKSVNGVLTASFVPNDGGVPANLTFNVVEDNEGILRAKPVENDVPEHRWNWYTVYFGNGVTVCYICSDFAGSKELPLVDLMISRDAFHNSDARATIINLNNVLKGWGFNVSHNYGPECYFGDKLNSEL